MNLCTSTFAYVYSIGLYKRIVNAVTQSIRIANADEQKQTKKDTNKVMSFPYDKNVLFLGIMVSHREHINSNDILINGINQAMFRIYSSRPFPGKVVF